MQAKKLSLAIVTALTITFILKYTSIENYLKQQTQQIELPTTFGLIFASLLFGFQVLCRFSCICDSERDDIMQMRKGENQKQSQAELKRWGKVAAKGTLSNNQMFVLITAIDLALCWHGRNKNRGDGLSSREIVVVFWLLTGRFLQIIGLMIGKKQKQSVLPIFGQTLQYFTILLSVTQVFGPSLF